MAYEPNKMAMLTPRMFDGTAPTLWTYGGSDAVGSVDGTDYVTNAADLGMKVGDFVFVLGASAGAGALMQCSAVDSDGNGTLVDFTTA